MKRRPVTSGVFILIVIAAMVFATASSLVSSIDAIEWYEDPQGVGRYALGPGVTLAEPFTIETLLHFSSDRGEPLIWLGGLAAERGGPPDALALVWRRVTTGWFPTWKLQLVSRLDLLPSGFVNRVEGEVAIIELVDVRPQVGREYRAAVSYDPVQDWLSVLLAEKQSGSVLFSAHVPIGDYRGVLYPGAGWHIPQGDGASLASETDSVSAAGSSGSEGSAGATGPAGSVESARFRDSAGSAGAAPPPVELKLVSVNSQSERYGLPLALVRNFRSQFLEFSAVEGSFKRKLGIEYLKGEPVGLRVEWPSEPVPGVVLVKAVAAAPAPLVGSPVTPGASAARSPKDGPRETLLATLEWQPGTVDVAFGPGELLPGESSLVLEYVDGQHRAEVQRHTLRVIQAKIGANYTVDGQDFDRNAYLGRLTLWPDAGTVENVELTVMGAIVLDAPSNTAGQVESQFEVARLRFDRLDEYVTIPFEVPVPAQGSLVRLTAAVSPWDVLIAGGTLELRGPKTDDTNLDPDLFPFVVNPWRESPDNVTNVSGWLDKPAGKHGFVTVENGHFVTGDGRRIRFLGVNCAFAGCFPDHASAEKIARQLARFGINLVRFHHMDMQEAPAGIWRRGVFPRELDPGQLDRLDYFIYQLKEHGIYSNLNLHVSRTMTPEEGYPEPERRPDFDKGLSLFDPGIMESQKAYAKALLTHRNPYTGNRYVDEPAIAMIEITNENGLILFTQWGAIDALPQRYRQELDARWQQWLFRRYGTTQALAEAWGGSSLEATRELATNGRFEGGLSHWTLETDEASQAARIQVVSGDGDASPAEAGEFEASAAVRAEQAQAAPMFPALQINVAQKGSVPWRPQVYHTDLAVEPGGIYRVSFWIKADQPRALTANLMMQHDPWAIFGSVTVEAAPQWQRVEFAVAVPESSQVRQGRVSFTNLEAGAVYWVTGLSVQQLAGGVGLPEEESLETGVQRPAWYSLGVRSPRVRQDYIEFLWSLEQAYFEEMYRYIKEELGARAAVSGTQVQWSPPGIQARLDYVDVHAYWNHPEFPGASWDQANWYVQNTSMVNSADGRTITSLAHPRVAGKPYVVSEYNHPAPNTYSSEAFLLAGAYGAFQDWDGLVAFAWSHDADFWPQRIPSFFDIKSHPTKLVTLPAVAALFLRGDVHAGEEPIYAMLDSETQLRRLLDTSVSGVGSAAAGVPPAVALQRRLALVIDDEESEKAVQLAVTLPPSPVDGRFTTDTREIEWRRQSSRGVVIIDTKRSKAVIGFGGPGNGQEGTAPRFDLSGVTIAPGPTRQDGWSAITLTAMDGADFQSPGRILLTATGYATNAGMGWESPGGDRVTVRNRWGEAPSIVEGISARIELPVAPDRVVVYALDGAGDRREQVPVRASSGTNRAGLAHDVRDVDGRAPRGEDARGQGLPQREARPPSSSTETTARAVIEIGPRYRTLWYEIEIVP